MEAYWDVTESGIPKYKSKSKGKGLPWQAEVPQGVPGRLRPRIFWRFGTYKGGRSSAKYTGRLYPRRNPWYSLSEAESTSGHMVLSGGTTGKKSPLTPPGIEPGTSRLVTQRLDHYDTPGPEYKNTRRKSGPRATLFNTVPAWTALGLILNSRY